MIRSKLAREKANNILRMYGVKKPAVDVHLVAQLLGFKIIPHDFPETVSAVIKIKDGVKVIGVNKNHSETRQRFSISHELGHYLSGHDDFSHEKMVVDKEKKYLDPHYRDEQEADEFAAELLMPEFMLKKDILEDNLDASTLARRYNVSEQAMWIQLINLELTPGQIKEPPRSELPLSD